MSSAARMTREALDFIQRNYLKETDVKHPDRAEAERYWNFPYAAMEEAVVNAVYHRSYEEREPIEVRITPDDLVVLSFPGPDRSIRMEDRRAGKAVSSRYRSRRIGEFLKELDLTEGRCAGIPKLLKVMEENGFPETEFEAHHDRTSLLIRLPIQARAMGQAEVGTKSGLSRDQVAPEVTPEVTPEVRLAKAIQGEMSRRELQDILGLEDDEHFRKAYLLPALEQGLIELTIPERPRSSKQRYRLTEKGRQLARGADKGP